VEQAVAQWLRHHGLAFNPFLPLRADQDARLWMYWVGNDDIFDLAWEAQPALLFAPWGGGKSALRTRLTQECWSTPAEKRPFPLVYLPQDNHVTLEDHLQDLILHGARELLLALARSPRRFLEASPRLQKEFAQFLATAAPPVSFWLEQMSEESSLAPLNRPYDPGYDLEIPREERGDWLSFVFTLARLLQENTYVPSSHTVKLWEALIFWIQEFLRRPCVYVLIDHLDATPSTAQNPAFIVQTIEPFLEVASEWASQQCYLKLFLPSVVQEKWTPPAPFTTATITWSAPLLLQVIQRRMVAASRGRMDALAALAEPALANLDEYLIGKTSPLPRELLILINAILEEHARRALPRIERPCLDDILQRGQEECSYGTSTLQ